MSQLRAVTSVAARSGLSQYHHFLMGLLVPLVNARATDASVRDASILRVPRCEPFVDLLREAMAAEVEQSDPEEFHDEALILTAYEYPWSYSRSVFVRVRSEVARLETAEEEVVQLDQTWTPRTPRVLLIDRGIGVPSPREPGGRTGLFRRSVSNHDALYAALQGEYPGCINVVLEGLSLARQFALFSLADVIVGQHGAGLTNLIWAKPEATAIEIFPDDLREEQRQPNFFGNLAECLGIRYRRVHQVHSHGTVDIDELRREVGQAVSRGGGGAGLQLLRRLRFRARIFHWKATAKLKRIL